MAVGILFFVVWSLFMLLVVLVLYVWGKRSGQFKDIESPKYQIFEEKELEEWPNRKKKAQGNAMKDRPADQKGGK
jgi:cbb3-type cytochrome oxidase maturation protein